MSGGASRAALLVDGHQILPALLADLRAARAWIHVSMFLWFRDPVGDEIADVLVERARAGVAVRVLINVQKTAMGDPFSTGEREMMEHDPAITWDPTDVRPLCERLREVGAEVFDTNIDYDAELAVDPRLRSIAAQIRETTNLDDLHVDHRKLVIVDGLIGYCGGANVGAQYMHHVAFDPLVHDQDEAKARLAAGLPEPWWKWHDSLTRFEGSVVAELERHFHDRFVLDGGPEYALPPPDEALPAAPPAEAPHLAAAPPTFTVRGTQVFANEPSGEPNAIRELYVRLIAEARTSIFIENPYLYHPAIVEALRAAKRGRPELDVTLVLPGDDWNDNSFGQDAQQHAYAEYVALGIAVHEYQNHFNHLKMAVFDERLSIHGSANLNFRSLEDDNDFELVVLVDDEAFARHVLSVVRDVDVTRSKRVTQDDLGLRVRVRDPRTLLLLSRRML